MSGNPDARIALRDRVPGDPVLWWLSIAPALGAPDLETRARELRTALPEGYTVLVEPPWVVVGDEPPERVRTRSEQTVRWATVHLEAQLFPARPDEPWTVWMFSGADAYERGAVSLLGHAPPDTPYGYALGGQLVMNIATGGGTLIHEMVHPYIDANAPDAPPWINEGLASLFEQCREREGKIVGLTNWRLAGLQATIRTGKLPPLEELLIADARTFYGPRSGTNYAAARYLMLWLQEQGALERFWRTWRADRQGDPTGAATLRAVIGTDDLPSWQRQWEAWVLGLSFP